MTQVHISTNSLLLLNAALRSLDNLNTAIDDIRDDVTSLAVLPDTVMEIANPDYSLFLTQIEQTKVSMADIRRYLNKMKALTK